MRIVGIEASEPEAGAIHTIDVWYSQRRDAWVVERLNADGDHMGAAQVFKDREDAEDCLCDWLRAHHETHLVAPFELPRVENVRRAA